MRPYTPTSIFTASHSLCHGGDFYAMSTIKDTLFGIIHTLVAPTFIPNNTHQSALPMIRRMVIFVYKALVERDLDQDGKSFPYPSNSHSIHIPLLRPRS